MRDEKNPSVLSKNSELARFWGVTARTISRWLTQSPPIPADDANSMIKWYFSLSQERQSKFTQKFRDRIFELTKQSGQVPVQNGGGDSRQAVNEDYRDFLATYDPKTGGKDALAVLEKNRAYWAFKLDRAQQQNDRVSIDFATKQHLRFESAIHDAQLRAKRLGLDQGELLARSEAERVFCAVAYWQMRCTDEALHDLGAQIAAASAAGPLPAEELERIIEPVLLTAKVLVPLTRAIQVNSSMKLPEWAVASMKKVIGEMLENGEEQFDQLYAVPPPQHA